MAEADRDLVDALDDVWRSVDAACADLTEAQWKTPTDLPGWSVQDNVAHVTAIESSLLGRPAPEHTPPELEHVKNDVGRMNEVWVDSRRAWPGDRVLDEFREVTGERLRVLRGYADRDFEKESWTPAGPGTVRDLLPFRIFDSWAHEQDIRRALGRPGGFDGPPAQLSLERIDGAMPYVVGKKVKPPDGTTVAFDVAGPAGRTLAIVVEGGRAKPLDAAPSDPTVRLGMAAETYACLACGRWDPDGALADGIVTLTGDDTLGRRIVAAMNFLF